MIPLKCGDPVEQPASYTRFVLPFAYCPEPAGPYHPTRVYQPAASASIWRKHYVTIETGAVLFERARWFDLQGVTFQPFTIRRGERSITVGVKPPCLVLFEWPSQARREAELSDLLCLGFLIIETYFPVQAEAASLDDLLAFNELFRYWRRPYKKHEEAEHGYRDLLADCPLDMTNPITRVRHNTTSAIYTKRWASLLDFPIEDTDGTRWRLVPPKWQKEADAWMEHAEKAWESGWIVYTDNRAFVWTCAILEQGNKTLADYFNVTVRSPFGHWVKLLNVDFPGRTPEETHETSPFERDWAAKRTYRRWQERGTLYGFNYHCGAMLGPPVEVPPVWQHFGEMYFDQTLLLLYLRVGSFRFSQKLSRLSAKARDRADLDTRQGFEKWRHSFEALREDFALFTNLYEFPLLSNQQQGIELYDIARRYMDVEGLFREIQEEIRSSHEYLEIRAAQNQTSLSTQLTVVATVGLAFGLASSLLGMNVLFDRSPEKSLRSDIIVFIIVLYLCSHLIFLCVKHVESILNFFECIRKQSIKDLLYPKKPQR